MASALKERMSEHLECAVCLGRYEEPRELSCRHLFCKKCLDGLLTKVGTTSKITCPECREDTEVENGDVTNLKTNFIINKLLSEMTTSDSDQSVCQKHRGETMQLFCETCYEPICQECTITDHQEHRYKFLKHVFLVEKENIVKTLEAAELNINFVRSAIESTGEKERKVRENSAKLHQEVRSFIGKQMEHLERKQLSLEKDVHDLTEAQIKRLEAEKESLSLPLGRMESTVELAKQALSKGNKVEILSRKTSIVQQLTKLNSKISKFKPYDTTIYKLEVNSFIDDETASEMARISDQVSKTKVHSPLSQEDEYYALSMRGGEYDVLYTTCDRQRVHFILESWSNNPTFRKSRKKVQVKITQPQSAAPKCPTVEDNRDGTYCFNYCPDVKGMYNIEITVNGRQICGSPFRWGVRDRPQLSTNNKQNALSGSSFIGGQHSWKVQYLFPEGRSAQTEAFVDKNISIEIGVAHGDNNIILVLSKHVTHHAGFSRLERPYNQGSRNTGKSSIQALQQGDVVVFYLNIGSSQLLIFNERSKESDRLFGVGSKPQPFISPYCSKYFRIPVSSIDA